MALPPAFTDLVGFFGIVALLLVLGALRLRTDAHGWRHEYRLALWLLLWQGGGLTLRLIGFV